MPKSEETRDALLKSALEVFSRNSFEKTTLRDITDRAGLSHGIIRYYFESKEELWFAAVEALYAQFNKAILVEDEAEMALLIQGDLHAVRRLVRRYVFYCARHPEHARIVLMESIAPSERLRRMVDDHVIASHQMAGLVFKALQAKGIVPPNAPMPSLMYIFVGACQNIFAVQDEVKMAHNYDCMTDEAIEAHAQTIMDLFVPLDAERA